MGNRPDSFESIQGPESDDLTVDKVWQIMSEFNSSPGLSRLAQISNEHLAGLRGLGGVSYRRDYEANHCLVIAIAHLLDIQFGNLSWEAQRKLPQEFNRGNPESLFAGTNVKGSVLSVGGVEAAAFGPLGAANMVIYDQHINGNLLYPQENLTFYQQRFEPGVESGSKHTLVIASMLFDQGSGLVDSISTLDIDYILAQHSYLSANIEKMRFRIREEYTMGAEEYRRSQGLSIKELCSSWNVSPRSYWHYLKAKLASYEENSDPENLPGYLMKLGFSEADIMEIKMLIATDYDSKTLKYMSYAQALWDCVEEGGLMVIDGDKAKVATIDLPNAYVLAHYKYYGLIPDDKDLLVVRKTSA